MVIAYVLVCGAFRTAIRRMKVEVALLRNAILQVSVGASPVVLRDGDIVHLAVDLIGRGIDERRTDAAEPRRFQRIQRP